MQPADAKAPKFDSKWWKSNKAKPADMDGQFEKALKAYEDAKKTLLQTGAGGGHIEEALRKVKQEADKKKKDPKLGALQKETKEALANYERQCELLLAEYAKISKTPIMTLSPMALIKSPMAKQFEEQCKKEFSTENFNFLSLMAKKPRLERRWYDDFVAQGAKFEINISSGTRAKFDKIAAAIKADPVLTPDTPETWAKAPWSEAMKEVDALLGRDTLRRFRDRVLVQGLKSKLP
jgi:hypothetical protein